MLECGGQLEFSRRFKILWTARVQHRVQDSAGHHCMAMQDTESVTGRHEKKLAGQTGAVGS